MTDDSILFLAAVAGMAIVGAVSIYTVIVTARAHLDGRSQWEAERRILLGMIAEQRGAFLEAELTQRVALLDAMEKQADRLQARSLQEVQAFRTPVQLPEMPRDDSDPDWQNPSMGYMRDRLRIESEMDEGGDRS